MTLCKLQTKPLKTFLGITILLAIVAITVLLMIVTLPDAFTYCAPDANHVLPCIILLLIALVGICSTLIIKMESHNAMISARAIAIVSISIAFIIISCLRTYYSYNTYTNRWIKINMLGLASSEINRWDIKETVHVNYFGNVLLLAKDGKFYTPYSFYYSPTLYLPDGRKKTLYYAVIDSPSNFVCYKEKEEQKLGAMGSDMKIIVQPDTYTVGDPIGFNDDDYNKYNYKFLLVKNDSDKYGLINMKGELVIPCEYDLMGTEFFSYAPENLLEGGYMYAVKDGEVMLVDTLKNVLSYDEYHKKFPQVELSSKSYVLEFCPSGSWGGDEPTPEVPEIEEAF